MTWADYWLPQLLSWVGSAVVGAIVGFLFRRSMKQLFGAAQAATKHALNASNQAQVASDNAALAARKAAAGVDVSEQAAKNSEVAAEQAKASRQMSEQAGEALVELAQLLGDERDARDREARQHDRLWASYLDLLRERYPDAYAREQRAFTDRVEELEEEVAE